MPLQQVIHELNLSASFHAVQRLLFTKERLGNFFSF